jgi:hypothetical protein
LFCSCFLTRIIFQCNSALNFILFFHSSACIVLTYIFRSIIWQCIYCDLFSRVLSCCCLQVCMRHRDGQDKTCPIEEKRNHSDSMARIVSVYCEKSRNRQKGIHAHEKKKQRRSNGIRLKRPFHNEVNKQKKLGETTTKDRGGRKKSHSTHSSGELKRIGEWMVYGKPTDGGMVCDCDCNTFCIEPRDLNGMGTAAKRSVTDEYLNNISQESRNETFVNAQTGGAAAAPPPFSFDSKNALRCARIASLSLATTYDCGVISRNQSRDRES